jgi:hypothetical protein
MGEDPRPSECFACRTDSPLLVRYAILADIHSNLEALEAVLADVEHQSVDQYICAGDVVGYGADPKPCLDRIRDLCAISVAGNHDWAVARTLSMEFFNAYARAAIEWTWEQLPAEDIEWLRTRPLTADVNEEAMIVHSTVHDPAAFDYLLTSYDAYLSIKVLERPLCFVGPQETVFLRPDFRRCPVFREHAQPSVALNIQGEANPQRGTICGRTNGWCAIWKNRRPSCRRRFSIWRNLKRWWSVAN